MTNLVDWTWVVGRMGRLIIRYGWDQRDVMIHPLVQCLPIDEHHSN
jgi:hypothetical protein